MERLLITDKKTYNLDKKTLVMGILNITPDSFSDGGKYADIEDAVKQAIAMEQAGADIIDIGGESTRPGHQPVTEEEELNRVIPIMKEVSRAVNIPISIDTYKAETAKQAIEAGASIINDVWGAKKEPEIAHVAANYNVPIILMHNRKDSTYQNIIEDMKQDLQESIEIASGAGVKRHHIILDPGIGFAKTVEDNLFIMRHLEKFKSLGYPMLLGTSRKSLIGKVLDLPVDQRDEGTGATVCYGISQGIDIVRVHNVEMTVRMTKMMDAMMAKGGNISG
ncbi:dihydropteroate synthase [Aquibacillus koreensis]|uniref:Dihydropteroate synthase n=1 Tax=Aquibacillus koreensis TaxID=279446 RepID=A0A9X3WPH8_9BACI|nr:dihydropteroate synthase [Aquibacillus koreensis]MCT2535301.1 dihydropteroate synthase [Aquibacillus koreensis]MDC3422358.1 dihydropteroate synthase [Aquibacillus koreensis]